MPPLKSERFEMRLDEDILARIDKWRTEQNDLPARAEAMRRLAEMGLERSSPENITFRPADKLIIAMLAHLFKQLKVDAGINPDLLLSVLYGGHNWALRWPATELPRHLFDNHEDRRDDVTFVVNVLDMWDFIEVGYQKLTKKEKDRIATEVNNPLGKHVKFRGFDSHHQSGEQGYLTIARFMINELGSFKSTFGGRDLDAHVPMAADYRNMYRVFEPMRKEPLGTNPLTVTQIIEILKAARA